MKNYQNLSSFATKANNSKKLILLATFIIFCQEIAFSQTCKFEKNETDKFTGSKVLVTQPSNFIHSTFLDKEGFFKVNRTGDEYSIYVQFNFNTDTQDPFKVEQGQQLILLLDNKDTILLTAVNLRVSNPGVPSQNIVNSSGYTEYISNTYNISNDQIDKILASPLSAIRMFCVLPTEVEKSIDADVKAKFKNVLISLFNCAMTN